jgi:hypothetical protein
VGDGAYYKRRMLDYIKQDKNCEKTRFIGLPKDGRKSYGNRLKVQETF